MSYGLVVSALREELTRLLPRAERLGLSASEAWNVLVVALLRDALQQLADARGRDRGSLSGGRLFTAVPGFEADSRAALRGRLLAELDAAALPATPNPWQQLPIEAFGQLYESLLAARPSDSQRNLRKRTGSYYTPEPLTLIVVQRALEALEAARGSKAFDQPLKILDPALGAGAFLVQAARETARRSERPLGQVVQQELYGVDISPLAVAVAEASLWLLADAPDLELAAAGAQLHEGDALCGSGAPRTLGRRGVDFDAILASRDGFDLVLGNPPWVAFAGRATQPLAPALREHYRESFVAFRGYPTLHALFVELSARVAPRGVVALLIPSPLADLEGYRPVRSVLSATHQVCEPLLELGQDAFESVTQPCFALVAVPRQVPEADPGRCFVLSERKNAAARATELRTPPALERLASLPRFPSELFGEMGLQTSSAITRQLLYRGNQPPAEYSYALLEGRNIAEFRLQAPRLFLKPDRTLLDQHRCRLRDVTEYRRVKLVVRQTAAITIAAAHDGTPFRNSLLAGFELQDFPFELTLGLLNSTLYRALHLAARRDARQGAFPQVKIAHLRALPAPQRSPACQKIAELAREAGRSGLSLELRRALDAAVFAEFSITAAEGDEIRDFVRDRSPQAGLVAPLS
jgi:methylase of polypeptide subunit release factors